MCYKMKLVGSNKELTYGDTIRFSIDGKPYNIRWAQSYSFRRVETLLRKNNGDVSEEKFLLLPVERIYEKNTGGTALDVKSFYLEYNQPASIILVKSFYEPTWVVLTQPTMTTEAYGYPKLYHHRIPVVKAVHSSLDTTRDLVFPNVRLNDVLAQSDAIPSRVVALQEEDNEQLAIL